MEDAQIIHHIYLAVKNTLIERLGRQGYVVVEEKENDPVFDSRFICWSNNTDCIRFTWDGKEGIFLIQVTEDLPITALTSWNTLSETALVPAPDAERQIYATAEQIIRSLG